MTYKTAWYVCHRIREAMSEEPGSKIGGESVVVEIDETYVGGRRRNVGKAVGMDNKTVVLGMAERGGNLHMEVISSRKLEAIKPVIDARLSSETAVVVTDSHPVYGRTIPKDKHKETNHKEELKDKNWTSTQTVENAFSLFKRGIVGNYHWLSPWHLNRYMREFCWRFNRRGLQPWIFGMALNNMVCRKPLPYRTLVKF